MNVAPYFQNLINSQCAKCEHFRLVTEVLVSGNTDNQGKLINTDKRKLDEPMLYCNELYSSIERFERCPAPSKRVLKQVVKE